MLDCSKVVPKKCKADCCYYVPIPNGLWEKHKDKAQRKVKVLKWNDENIMPLTESMRCPFVDKNFRCVIYEERPPICRLFGQGNCRGLRCMYLKPDGSKRGKGARDRMLRANERNLNRIVGRINQAFEFKREGKTDEEIIKIMGRADEE